MLTIRISNHPHTSLSNNKELGFFFLFKAAEVKAVFRLKVLEHLPLFVIAKYVFNLTIFLRVR